MRRNLNKAKRECRRKKRTKIYFFHSESWASQLRRLQNCRKAWLCSFYGKSKATTLKLQAWSIRVMLKTFERVDRDIKRSIYAQKHSIKPAIPQRSNAAMFCYIFQCFCCSNLAFKARNYLSYIKIIYSSNASDLTKNLRQKLVKLETHPNSLFN